MLHAQWCQTNQNDRVWSRVRFISKAKQGEQVACAQKTWTPQWILGKSFTGYIGRCGWSARCVTLLWLVGGEVTGNLHHPGISIISLWFQPVWGPRFVLSLKLPSSTWVGALVPVEELRDLYQIVLYILPRRNQDPVPSLHCCFFLHSLIPLISNCLNLPFGTQGRSKRLKLFSYKQEMGDTERLLCPGGPHRVLLRFNPHFSMIFPNL